jgi:hypothetical protein
MAGLGLVGTALAGAAMGAGTVGAEAMDWVKRSTLNDQLAELQKQRDERLEGFAKGREERGYAHAEKTQERGFTHAERMQQSGQEFTKGENNLNRQLQQNIAQLHEKAATERHNETIRVQMARLGLAQQQFNLAKEQITLMPMADGTFQKVDRHGNSKGTATDLNGNPLQGAKDISKSTQMLMEANNVLLKGLEAEMRAETDPAEKAKIRERVDFFHKYQETLAGVGGNKRPEQTFQAPSEEHIKAARARQNNPQAKTAFEQQFGPGSWDKFVKPAPAKPGPAPQAGAAPSAAAPSAADYSADQLKAMRIGPLTPLGLINQAAAAGNPAAIQWKQQKADEEQARVEANAPY